MPDRNLLGKRIVEGDNNYWIRLICGEELIELGKKKKKKPKIYFPNISNFFLDNT